MTIFGSRGVVILFYFNIEIFWGLQCVVGFIYCHCIIVIVYVLQCRRKGNVAGVAGLNILDSVQGEALMRGPNARAISPRCLVCQNIV